MILRSTNVALFLAAAALWPGSAQANNPGCSLERAGRLCRISAHLYAPEEARAAALFRKSFISLLESDAGDRDSLAAGPTLVYDPGADDTWIKAKSSDAPGALSLSLDDLDMTFMLTAGQPELLSDYEHWYRVSRSPSDFTDDDRPEMWFTVVPKPSVVWVLALSLAVVALRRVHARFASREL